MLVLVGGATVFDAVAVLVAVGGTAVLVAVAVLVTVGVLVGCVAVAAVRLDGYRMADRFRACVWRDVVDAIVSCQAVIVNVVEPGTLPTW